MKDRIQQIMIHQGMNQQEFSLATGIAPASLSSIFTGRTSPTLKHAEALHNYLPELNMDWLLFGTGEMIKQTDAEGAEAGSTETSSSLGSSFGASPQFAFPPVTGAGQGPDQAAQTVASTAHPGVVDGMNAAAYVPQIPVEYLKKLDIKPRRIAEIRIFFDDGTFEVFKGNE